MRVEVLVRITNQNPPLKLPTGHIQCIGYEFERITSTTKDTHNSSRQQNILVAHCLKTSGRELALIWGYIHRYTRIRNIERIKKFDAAYRQRCIVSDETNKQGIRPTVTATWIYRVKEIPIDRWMKHLSMEGRVQGSMNTHTSILLHEERGQYPVSQIVDWTTGKCQTANVPHWFKQSYRVNVVADHVEIKNVDI